MDKAIFNNTVLALLKAAPGLGSVQINKGLIMIDAFYHAHFKKTLTGITYIKHWFGPVPDFAAHDELYRMEFNKIKVIKEMKKLFIFLICIFPYEKSALFRCKLTKCPYRFVKKSLEPDKPLKKARKKSRAFFEKFPKNPLTLWVLWSTFEL